MTAVYMASLFYIEPHRCGTRLFAVERFIGRLWDPFCGTGRVADAGRAAGYSVWATDIVDRAAAVTTIGVHPDLVRVRS
jgi:hypothetical protein